MRNFRRLRVFARIKNENWCVAIAYVDKKVNDINGVKYLLVRQDLFDRTVEAKEMKTKYSNETARAFFTNHTKRYRPPKTWVNDGKDFAGEFRKQCKAEGVQIYSTVSGTQAAFAERTTQY